MDDSTSTRSCESIYGEQLPSTSDELNVSLNDSSIHSRSESPIPPTVMNVCIVVKLHWALCNSSLWTKKVLFSTVYALYFLMNHEIL